MRQEFQKMYSSAENAYGALDFTGLGIVTQETMLACPIVKDKLLKRFTHQEVLDFFVDQNLFNPTQKGLNFDSFKKNFFPHLYLVQEDADDLQDKIAFDDRYQLDNNLDKQPVKIEARLVKLENKLKDKFSSCFESVRKAFLGLDTDYDGYITVEDILKYLGNDSELNYSDLKKLLKDKDSKKVGRINYSDFSKWLGSAIHMSEGFYFRHDSIKNPYFDLNQQQQDKEKKADKTVAAKCLLTGDIEAKILDKIKIQWKTLRKAFMDLNIEKTGRISMKEFKFFLNFWGMDISEAETQKCFSKFDIDRDGFISYKDFQTSIGADMFPAEGLYFRQDKEQACKINSCHHAECF